MSKPFEAAIRNMKFWSRESLGPTKRERESYEAAIRVLEVAGKVDKARVISLVSGSELLHQLTRCAADPPQYVTDRDGEAQLRALLAALPDKDSK